MTKQELLAEDKISRIIRLAKYLNFTLDDFFSDIAFLYRKTQERNNFIDFRLSLIERRILKKLICFAINHPDKFILEKDDIGGTDTYFVRAAYNDGYLFYVFYGDTGYIHLDQLYNDKYKEYKPMKEIEIGMTRGDVLKQYFEYPKGYYTRLASLAGFDISKYKYEYSLLDKNKDEYKNLSKDEKIIVKNFTKMIIWVFMIYLSENKDKYELCLEDTTTMLDCLPVICIKEKGTNSYVYCRPYTSSGEEVYNAMKEIFDYKEEDE